MEAHLFLYDCREPVTLGTESTNAVL